MAKKKFVTGFISVYLFKYKKVPSGLYEKHKILVYVLHFILIVLLQ